MTGNPPDWEPGNFRARGSYILKYRKPIPCPDLFVWGKWMERGNRRVRHTIIGDIRISTVFLGLDHNFLGEGKPILFETMIFPDGDQWRCGTWRQALTQHRVAVGIIKGERNATAK